jgi:hypothetical protein
MEAMEAALVFYKEKKAVEKERKAVAKAARKASKKGKKGGAKKKKKVVSTAETDAMMKELTRSESLKVTSPFGV